MGVVLKRLAQDLFPLQQQQLEPPWQPGPMVRLTCACKQHGPRLGSRLMVFK